MDQNQEQIFELEIEVLEANPLQPRGLITPESIGELTDSIREHGVLEPLVVAKTPAGFQIIAGERRWRAAKLAGLVKVPVIIRETTPRGMLEMAIVENVQREDLNPIERAQAYKRLIDEFGITVTDIAKRVSKSLPYVSNTLRLLQLPDAIKDALVSGLVSEGHVRPLLTLGDQRAMIDAFRQLLRSDGSVRMAEDLARKMKDEILQMEPSHKKVSKIYSPELEQMAKEIRDAWNADKVLVSQSQVMAKIHMEFKGDTEQTKPLLEKLHQLLKAKN